ncbi:MAG: glycoside hydrolase family 88 protein [Butyrivibrio sp.]|uniref:glycoside hydrolase family 88 protein n=1 Tax=Butyrivibrio sp. TaxID=28121 RepID=UPI0025C61184|nr:glycoside hydrolase family 88 protein [Butyrivibrio sp.]MBQ6589052.1 glycoside hydrolase family 88 protein [Butyrivibrio sp.]
MSGYELLVTKTAEELGNIMKVTPSQKAKDMVKKLLGRSVRTKDPMFWPSGMLMLGLSEAICNCKEQPELESRIRKALDAHMSLWRDKYGSRIRFVDDALAGYSMLGLSEGDSSDIYRKGRDIIREYLKVAKTDSLGSIIYNPGRNNTNIFADGIGQATMFMAAEVRDKFVAGENSYGENTQNDLYYYNSSDYLSIVGKIYVQFMNYYKYGRDSKSGLLYHGYQISRDQYDQKGEAICERKGILGWGRTHGWMMLGLSQAAILEQELSRKIEDKKEWSIFDLLPWYVELCETAMDYQREDGGFSWQINAVDGHIDMSATGMIAYSMAKGYEAGLFDKDEKQKERVRDSLLKAKESMLEHVKDGIVMDALSSCDDFAVHYQTYGNYPWGQGAVLAAVSVINRII